MPSSPSPSLSPSPAPRVLLRRRSGALAGRVCASSPPVPADSPASAVPLTEDALIALDFEGVQVGDEEDNSPNIKEQICEIKRRKGMATLPRHRMDEIHDMGRVLVPETPPSSSEERGIAINKGKGRALYNTGSIPTTPDRPELSTVASAASSLRDWTTLNPLPVEGIKNLAVISGGVAYDGGDDGAEGYLGDVEDGWDREASITDRPPAKKRIRAESRSPSPDQGPAIVRRRGRAPAGAARLLTKSRNGLAPPTATLAHAPRGHPSPVIELAHDKLVALVAAMEENDRLGASARTRKEDAVPPRPVAGSSGDGVVSLDSASGSAAVASGRDSSEERYWADQWDPCADEIPGAGGTGSPDNMVLDEENIPCPPRNTPCLSEARYSHDGIANPAGNEETTPRVRALPLRADTPRPRLAALSPNTPMVRVNLRNSVPLHMRDLAALQPPQGMATPGFAGVPGGAQIGGASGALPPVQLSFTLVPAGGFPTVALSAPDALFRDLARSRQAAIWSEDPSRTLLATVYNSAYPRPGTVRALTNAMTVAVRVAAEDSAPIVVPPETDWAPAGTPRGAPITWVILRLNPESATRLLSRPVWSTTHLWLPP
ncbi:hypothetical protein C2E23DRAFT_890266 [Lenzites betulinus]|nr:hypothetical protein C2E23DRAFT_890266 [Lenzites betulinus]